MKKFITLITAFALAVTSMPFTAVCADKGESAAAPKAYTAVTEAPVPTSADDNSGTYVTTTAVPTTTIVNQPVMTTMEYMPMPHPIYSFRAVQSYPIITDYAQGEDLKFSGLMIAADCINDPLGYERTYSYNYFNSYFSPNSDGKIKVTVTDEDGNVTEGKDFNTLPSGTYTVNITGELGDYYMYNLCRDLDISYKVIISEDGAENILWGDANGNGTVDVSDAVLVMQSLANPSKYKLPLKGKRNADVYGSYDGITVNDALSIQKYLLKLVDSLPLNPDTNAYIPKTTTTNAAANTTTTTAVATNIVQYVVTDFYGTGGGALIVTTALKEGEPEPNGWYDDMIDEARNKKTTTTSAE